MMDRTGDSLRDLSNSTLEFFKRFDVVPNVTDCARNLREEVGELIDATQDGANHDHIAEEAADVFVTAIGLAHAAGVDTDRLIQQVYTVIAKNDAKTHETHAHADGKIRRRQPK